MDDCNEGGGDTVATRCGPSGLFLPDPDFFFLDILGGRAGPAYGVRSESARVCRFCGFTRITP